MAFLSFIGKKNNEEEVSSYSEEREVETVTPEEAEEKTVVSKYVTSLVCGQYAKSVEDIANTKVGNKITRKRNLQQVMQESFFYGANRFGNNFIA